VELLIVLVIITVSTGIIGGLAARQYQNYRLAKWRKEVGILEEALLTHYKSQGAYPQFSGGNAPATFQSILPKHNEREEDDGRIEQVLWMDTSGQYARAILYDPPMAVSASVLNGLSDKWRILNDQVVGDFVPVSELPGGNAEFEKIQLETQGLDYYESVLFGKNH
jgi:type II secretory pathway pseudopilin PulG